MASILDLADDSSDSENDVDYVPSEDEASELSLGENTDEEDPPDAEPTFKRKKRKKGKRDDQKLNNDDTTPEDGEEKKCVNEEDEKKRTENLWQDFLQDVTPPVKKNPATCENKTSVDVSRTNLKKKIEQPPQKVTVSEVFEFAGEEVVVTKEVDQNSEEAKRAAEKTVDPTSQLVQQERQNAAPKRPSGLGSVLGTIMNKKQKLSTLQKSMLDWKSFKKDEGIEEELDQHRRGKDSYVDKQAFLQRSDLRQFEIEKNIRLSSKSNR